MNKVPQTVTDGKQPGFLITFEGGEGVGKSTQIELLKDRLASRGKSVTVSREPGGTRGAEAVRHVLLEAGAAEPFGARMEAVLFAAARNDHVEQVIRPALKRGDIVLVDRFIDSTRVYQGVSGQLAPAFIQALERVAIAGVMPDLTILLDMPSAQGLTRAAGRRHSGQQADRFEKETVQVHEDRRQAFLRIARNESQRIRVIDASGPPDEIGDRIWTVVSEFLALRHALSSGSVPPNRDHAPATGLQPEKKI